ncbi:hypothetical protein [Plebeiibacterium sediminum]|uniref:Sodium:proton antiporter n=1 Tax=Plebeiibacterium sediminum TaxID=2992112 RepID=A0AAE3M918_9BACT|nr:hypothetical protein [Plebeiobacterium sediminum]MCW3789162.1 hypothetical protein [Plebeiobacterium sediminum]
MKKVYILSLLLLLGLVSSQVLPLIISSYSFLSHVIKLGTMICLAFIMIHVGYEFEIKKDRLKQYGYDYLIAFTSATLPWIFVAIYFIFVLTPDDMRNGQTWVESLLAARFAAPTSAGVLFSMLAAAGLATTWMFKKTRVLAIFDDLDTVILMVPLQMLIIGFKIQLIIVLLIMFILIAIAWKYMGRIRLSIRWKYVLLYAVVITLAAEFFYFASKIIDETVSVHIEVLLPAFVLGTIISKKYNKVKLHNGPKEDILELKDEQKISFYISAIFMVLVGLSMPLLEGVSDFFVTQQVDKDIVDSYLQGSESSVFKGDIKESFELSTVLFHVLMVTILSNIGKIVPAFVYRNEATWKERLAVALAMFPRGEVGAGVLIISMSYGIGGIIVTVSMLSLALNLLLTGIFIVGVKALIKDKENTSAIE